MNGSTRRLYLVRHGLPDYRGHHAGDLLPGPPLSDTGRAQAAQAADVLRQLPIERIYCSPLARTQQTAAVINRTLQRPVQTASDLREWHRSEDLYRVSTRLARWLVQWLRRGPPTAVAVSHASPILAILRTALYLPHVGWYRAGRPELLELSSGDRFEVSMASVFELVIDAQRVAARCLFHPRPRVMSLRCGRATRYLPRPVIGHGENATVVRPNLLHLSGGC